MVELRDKIEEEMKAIVDTVIELEEKSYLTDSQLKEVFRANIEILHKQHQELKDSMIENEELKEKIINAEKKLQNMYQLEIRTEVNKLNTEMIKKNQDILDTFSNKFAEYKSKLEKAASQRGDDHNTALDNLRKNLTMLRLSIYFKWWNGLDDLSQINWQENITSERINKSNVFNKKLKLI